jgi:hypothetical protein
MVKPQVAGTIQYIEWLILNDRAQPSFIAGVCCGWQGARSAPAPPTPAVRSLRTSWRMGTPPTPPACINSATPSTNGATWTVAGYVRHAPDAPLPSGGARAELGRCIAAGLSLYFLRKREKERQPSGEEGGGTHVRACTENLLRCLVCWWHLSRGQHRTNCLKRAHWIDARLSSDLGTTNWSNKAWARSGQSPKKES